MDRPSSNPDFAITDRAVEIFPGVQPELHETVLEYPDTMDSGSSTFIQFQDEIRVIITDLTSHQAQTTIPSAPKRKTRMLHFAFYIFPVAG